MKFMEFNNLLMAYRKYGEIISDAYKVGFDLLEGKFSTSSCVEDMIRIAITSHYGDNGWDWVSWFIWEMNYGKREDLRGWDEEGNIICDYASLYTYLESKHKISNQEKDT